MPSLIVEGVLPLQRDFFSRARDYTTLATTTFESLARPYNPRDDDSRVVIEAIQPLDHDL